MNVNLIGIESPQNTINQDQYISYMKYEETNAAENLLKEQYVDLESLGSNIFEDITIDDEQKLSLYLPMIEFIHNNYISIGDYEALTTSPNRSITAGDYIYSFICVDNVNSILPAFIESLDCSNIVDFDELMNDKYLKAPEQFNKDYMNIIQITIRQLLKLQGLDDSVNKDKNYQKLLAKYYYYQEIIDYGNTELFLNNYIYKVLNKYFNMLLWRGL